MADTDGDRVSDADERLWSQNETLAIDLAGHPFHPGVPNEPWLSVTAEAVPDMVPAGERYLSRFAYTTTVETNIPLDPSLLELELPGYIYTFDDGTSFTLPFDPVGFTKPQTVTQPSNLAVVPYEPSHLVDLKSRVTARVSRAPACPAPSRSS